MDKISSKLDLKTRGDFRQLTESSTSENKPEFDSNSILWELWDRMSEYYGSAFVSQYGDEPTVTWAHILKGLTADEFRRGFDLLPNRDSSFPPDPGEFRALIGKDDRWRRQCHKYYSPDTLLEDKTAREQRQEFSVEQARSLLDNF